MPIALPTIIRLGLAVLTLSLVGPLAAQQSFSTLEERMTAAEFRAAGLDKLSGEELSALNRWIQARSLTENEALELVGGSAPSRAATAAEDRRGLSNSERDEPIISILPGPFNGWSGRQEFELQNGMVWRMTEPSTFAIGTIDSPQVTIRPGVLGAWYLSVEDYNREVRVVRIR